MSAMLHSAFNSITSWVMEDENQVEEDGNYKFHCDSQRLIELVMEKANEKDECVDVEQKTDELNVSPRHKKCPSPSLMKTSRVAPPTDLEENVLTERLLRDRAQSGELGMRVGEGSLSMELIEEPADGKELLLLKIDDASPATLRKLSEIPESSSTIIALCFDCTEEERAKLEEAVRGPAFSWRLGPLDHRKDRLSDDDFEAFVAIARAILVLHVVQAAGF